MTDILSLLAAAAAQGHDEMQIRAEITKRLIALRPHLPPAPIVPRRIHERLLRPERLDLMRIDGVVTAIAEAIGPDDGKMWSELLALNLLAARLGATVCTLRLGRHVIAALTPAPAPEAYLGEGGKPVDFDTAD